MKVICLLLCCCFSTCVTKWSLEEIKLNESWHDCAFFKQGCPLFSRNYDNFQKKKIQHHLLVPESEVLYRELSSEDNAFIFGNDALTQFKFYGDQIRHPNYQINITSKEMEKCESEKNCKKLDDCQTGNIQYESNSEDVPKYITREVQYFSWKENYNKSMEILYQFDNELVKCQDFSNHIKISTLVMYGTSKVRIAATKHKFKCTNQESTFNTSWRLEDGNSVYLEILHCKHCKMNFSWDCNGTTINATVKDNIQTDMCFRDNFCSNGWKEVIVQGPQNMTYTNCSLKIKTFTENNDPAIFEKFWVISQSIAVRNESELATDTITSTTTSSPTITSTCNPNCKSNINSENIPTILADMKNVIFIMIIRVLLLLF